MRAQKIVDGVMRGLLDRAVLEVVNFSLERIKAGKTIVVVREAVTDRRPRSERRSFLERQHLRATDPATANGHRTLRHRVRYLVGEAVVFGRESSHATTAATNCAR